MNIIFETLQNPGKEHWHYVKAAEKGRLLLYREHPDLLYLIEELKGFAIQKNKLPLK